MTYRFLPAAGQSVVRAARTLLVGGVLLTSLAACGSKSKTTDPDPTTTPNPGTTDPPAFVQTGFSTQNGGTSGGASGSTVTVTTLADLQQYASSATPFVIKIEGTISGGTQGASVNVNSNKTLLGVGSTAFLQGVGLTINGKRNVIVRNIKFTMSTVTNTYTNDEGRQQVAVNDGDCVTIENSQNLWIDHCEFYNIDPAVQTNQDLYDGLVDAKGTSQYITVSWSYFHDHHKCHLIGSSDSDVATDRKMTFHHNYYNNIKERLPSYRGGTAHVFNNYIKHAPGSGVNSRVGACILVENNTFEDVRDPVTTKNSTVTGSWSATGNQYLSCTGSQPTNSGCTLAVPYPYSGVLTPAAEAKDAVLTKAGVGKL